MGLKKRSPSKTGVLTYEEQIAELPLEAEGCLTVESHLRELNFLQNGLSSVTNQLNPERKRPSEEVLYKEAA